MSPTPIQFGNAFFMRGNRTELNAAAKLFQNAAESQKLAFSQETHGALFQTENDPNPFEQRYFYTGPDADKHTRYLARKAPYTSKMNEIQLKMEKALGKTLSLDATLSWYAGPMALAYNTGNFLRTRLQKLWRLTTNNPLPQYPDSCKKFDQAVHAAHTPVETPEVCISIGQNFPPVPDAENRDLIRLQERLTDGSLNLATSVLSIEVPIT